MSVSKASQQQLRSFESAFLRVTKPKARQPEPSSFLSTCYHLCYFMLLDTLCSGTPWPSSGTWTLSGPPQLHCWATPLLSGGTAVGLGTALRTDALTGNCGTKLWAVEVVGEAACGCLQRNRAGDLPMPRGFSNSSNAALLCSCRDVRRVSMKGRPHPQSSSPASCWNLGVGALGFEDVTLALTSSSLNHFTPRDHGR